MVDRFGPRRMLTVATLLCGAGSVLFASAPGIDLAYAGRALIGAGAGVAWIGALQIAGLMFPSSRFAALSGLTLLMGMVGAVGAQAPLALMIAAAGWRATMVVAGVAAAGLAAAIWFTVRDSAGHGGKHHAATNFTGLVQGLRGGAAIPQTWTCGVFGAGLGVPVLAFAGLWGVPYMMQTYGLDRPDAALCTTWMLIGWAIGAPLAGMAFRPAAQPPQADAGGGHGRPRHPGPGPLRTRAAAGRRPGPAAAARHLRRRHGAVLRHGARDSTGRPSARRWFRWST